MTAMVEGTDYELVPADGTEALNDQAWDVRLTTGSFVETVLRFGNIKFNAEDGCLNFSFMIQSTPDSNISEEDVGLQDWITGTRWCYTRKYPRDGSTRRTTTVG